MSTAVFEVAKTIKERRLEVDTLLREAEKCQKSNPRLYNYLCRACCVLMASHLEGFLKDLTKSLLLDFNYNRGSFSKMPPAMKRAFCERIAFYDKLEKKEIESRIKQLENFFDRNSVPIELDAFQYKQNSNKNPTGDFIDGAFAKVGVPNIVYSISGSPLDSTFGNDERSNVVMLREIIRFRSYLFNFPYRRLPFRYQFNYNAPKGAAGGTIWHTLVEDIMLRRHSIAHGDTMGNVATHFALRKDIAKIDVFMHGLMLSAAAYLAA